MAKIMGDLMINASSYDLIIVAGDFKIGDATVQHQQLLLMAGKGDFKLTPLVGVEVVTHLHDHKNTLARDARIEFINDGMQVSAIDVVNGKIIINAKY